MSTPASLDSLIHVHSNPSSALDPSLSIPRETAPPATGQSRLLARPQRTARAPGYLSDYHCSFIHSSSSSSPHKKARYPLSCVDTFANLNPLFHHHLLSYSLDPEHTSLKQAMASPEFRQATNVELQAMENNRTWTVVSLPPGKSVVGCKWVFHNQI